MPKFPLLPLILVVGLSLFMEETSSSSAVIIDETIMDEDVATMAIGDNEKNGIEEEEDDSSVSEWNSINKFKRATTDSGSDDDDDDDDDEEEDHHVPEGRKKGHHGKKCRGKNGRRGCSRGHTCVRTCRSKCVRSSSAFDVPASCLATDKIKISDRCNVTLDEEFEITSLGNDTCCTGGCVETTDAEDMAIALCCVGPKMPFSSCSPDKPDECCSGICKSVKIATGPTVPSCCKGRVGNDKYGPCKTDDDCCLTKCDTTTGQCQ